MMKGYTRKIATVSKRGMAWLGAPMFLLLAALTSVAAPANAQPAIPEQAQWAAHKQFIALPSGVRMAYIEFGDPKGKPLLLIHGYTDSSRTWTTIAPYLKNRRLIGVDLRGHGDSSVPDCCFSIPEIANDVSEFITARRLGRIDVMGHSLGSMTAQYLAAFHPDQVGSVILVGSSASPGIKPGTPLWDLAMSLHDPIDPNSQTMMDIYANARPVNAEFLRYARQDAARIPIKVWRGVLEALAVTDFTQIQPLIKARLMILSGDLDPIFTPEHQEKLRKMHSDADFVVMHGAGHSMIWEFPEQAAAAISKFLDGTE
jgi:pimeloyl-ACP methyl ester carboxylesterase